MPGVETAAAFIEKMIREVTTGKRAAVPGFVLCCALSVLALAAAAQPLSAVSAAEEQAPAVPPSAAPEPVEPSPSPAPEVQAPSPAPDAKPAPIPSDGAAIRTRFGDPDFVRREMDNELWRYDANRCSVFFFLQRRGAMLQLRYTETLPRGMDVAADPACVASLEQRMARMPGEVTGSTAPQP